MQSPISAETAATRHPELYAQVVAQLTQPPRKASTTPAPLPDPAGWVWSYQSALRIDGNSQPADGLLGRSRLEAQKDHLYLSLEARAGRKSARVEFDNAALLAGPDTSLPQEALGLRPAPAGATVWVWQPDDKARPGWHEGRLLGASRLPNGTAVMSIELDLEYTRTLTRAADATRWDYCFDLRSVSNTAAKLRAALETGQAQAGIVPLSLADLQATGLLDEDARIVCAAPRIEALLGVLRRYPGFAMFGSDNGESLREHDAAQAALDVPDPASIPPSGRHWAWNSSPTAESLGLRNIWDRPQLVVRSAVMNFHDMMTMMSSPDTAIDQRLAKMHARSEQVGLRAYAVGADAAVAGQVAYDHLLGYADNANQAAITDWASLWATLDAQVRAGLNPSPITPSGPPIRRGPH